MRRKLRTLGLLLVRTLLVLYPNPLMLGRAVAQSWTPVVDAGAVRDRRLRRKPLSLPVAGA